MIPYGISIGNHDGAPSATAAYNEHFGIARFTGRPYYGGHYGSDNNNNYALFSAGGMDFIVINLGGGTTTPTAEVFAWANNLLQTTYSNRRAIVLNHQLLDGVNWAGPGQPIYEALRGNPNLFMMLCGHLNTEYMRTDTYNNNTIYTVLSDYQGVTNGGNGWLRIFTFSPSSNTITISSHSPYLGQSDYSAPIVLPYTMSDASSFELIGTNANVSSGSTTGITWPAVTEGNTEYEWYVTVDNGENTITGPVWSFITAPVNTWTGATNTDWNVTSNWSGSVIPTSGVNVVINSSAGNQPVISGTPAALCNGLTIGSGASLIINEGQALTVSGNLNNAGALTVNSNSTLSGSLIVSGNAAGSVSYNRFINITNYHYYSSPVASNTMPNTGKVDGVWLWDEPAGDWAAVANTTACLSGIGYTSKTNGDGILTFSGTLLASGITIPASSPYSDVIIGNEANYDGRSYVAGRDPDIGGIYGGGGWNLLGNPYTSAISVSAFIDANYSVTPANSKFDPNYVALYLYNGSTYNYVAKSTGWPDGDYLSATHIQVGQGFFVLAMNDLSTFTFTRSMQGHNVGVSLLKSAKAEDRWPGLEVKVKYGEKENSTLIVYNENMTAGLDPGYDVGQLNASPEVEIYTSLVEKDNSVNFARQALPMTDFNRNIVPVGIDFGERRRGNFLGLHCSPREF